MRIDLRVKHDVETRRLAAKLFVNGLGRAHSRQNGTQDDARDGHRLRDPPRDRLSQVQLLQGQGRQDFRKRHRQGLRSRRAVGEDGYRRHRV